MCIIAEAASSILLTCHAESILISPLPESQCLGSTQLLRNTKRKTAKHSDFVSSERELQSSSPRPCPRFAYSVATIIENHDLLNHTNLRLRFLHSSEESLPRCLTVLVAWSGASLTPGHSSSPASIASGSFWWQFVVSLAVLASLCSSGRSCSICWSCVGAGSRESWTRGSLTGWRWCAQMSQVDGFNCFVEYFRWTHGSGGLGGGIDRRIVWRKEERWAFASGSLQKKVC